MNVNHEERDEDFNHERREGTKDNNNVYSS
jgi:hypothetical protein